MDTNFSILPSVNFWIEGLPLTFSLLINFDKRLRSVFDEVKLLKHKKVKMFRSEQCNQLNKCKTTTKQTVKEQ